MATTTTAPRMMTVEEYDALPEDGQKHELLWGELISVAPNFQHMALVSRLVEELGGYVRRGKLGLAGPEGTFVFPTERPLLLIPDIAFVRADRIPPKDERLGLIHDVPDLVIEVVSPSETSRIIHAKANAYLDQGVRLAVVVYPEREEIVIWSRDRTTRVLGFGDELSFGDVVPGFSLAVATLFEE